MPVRPARSALTALILVVLAAPALGQNDGGGADEALRARDEAAISAAIHRIETAWVEGDAEGVAANFASDAVYVAPGGARADGKAAIQSGFARALEGLFTETSLAHVEIPIRFLGRDAAITHYEAMIAPTGAAAKPACSPDATMVLERVPSDFDADGEWVVQYLALADSPYSDCVAASSARQATDAP